MKTRPKPRPSDDARRDAFLRKIRDIRRNGGNKRPQGQ